MHELAALLLAVDCALSVRGNCGLIDPMKDVTIVHELALKLPSQASQDRFLSPRVCQFEHYMDLPKVLYCTKCRITLLTQAGAIKMMLPSTPLLVPTEEGLKWSRIPVSPYPRSKLDDQRLLLP